MSLLAFLRDFVRVGTSCESASVMVPSTLSEAPDVEMWDPLFQELDRQRIANQSGDRLTLVVGIHRENRDAWVQIASSEDVEETVLLHFVPGSKPDTALRSLQTWYEMSRAERPHLVDIPRIM
jgi:hypothetical protein